jgi:hypothetical protein
VFLHISVPRILFPFNVMKFFVVSALPALFYRHFTISLECLQQIYSHECYFQRLAFLPAEQSWNELPSRNVHKYIFSRSGNITQLQRRICSALNGAYIHIFSI